MSNVYLDPKIWGPHFWFFLHTVSMTYPHYPSTVTKKKYYDFIMNLPLFIPVEQTSVQFEKLLEKYPITPYLDNRDSFVKWVHFIHNKINEQLEKPIISLEDFFVNYYNQYKSKNEKYIEYYKLKNKLIYIGIFIVILVSIYYLYDK